MKKLFALLVSLAMALSLAVPAFADGPSEDPDSAGTLFRGGLSWWVEADSYLNSHPGLEEQLRENAYDYFAQEYTWYESAQEYMEYWEMTEEEFLDEMVAEQIWELVWAEYSQNQIDLQKAALGGVPGQIGVMVNGRYIQFPDAVPEVTNGRTMMPVRALVDTLGGEASYQDGTVRFAIDGREYDFDIGSTTVTVRDQDTGASVGTLEMDCAPYIKDGRTYVPIRFIGEALGYTLSWDADYETAILVDADALAAEIDANFTILNRVAANSALSIEEGKSYRSDAAGNVTVTLFDTLNGNKTFQADLTGSALFNADAASATCSIAMSGSTADALIKLLMGGEGPAYEEDAAILRTILMGMEDMQFIMTREGQYWFHAPMLDELSGVENVWITDFDPDLVRASFAGTDGLTIGQLLAAMCATSDVESWVQLESDLAELAAAVGDSCFATQGGVSTLTVNLDTLDPDGGRGLRKECKELSFTLTVDEKGGTAITFLVESASELGMPAVRFSVEGALSSGQSSMTMEFHVANILEAEISMSSTWQTTTQQPTTQPPQGATVLDTDAGGLLEL